MVHERGHAFPISFIAAFRRRACPEGGRGQGPQLEMTLQLVGWRLRREALRGCDRAMDGPAFELSNLRDARLAPLATSTFPACLWSKDARRIVWANPTGAALFGASSSAAISA